MVSRISFESHNIPGPFQWTMDVELQPLKLQIFLITLKILRHSWKIQTNKYCLFVRYSLALKQIWSNVGCWERQVPYSYLWIYWAFYTVSTIHACWLYHHCYFQFNRQQNGIVLNLFHRLCHTRVSFPRFFHVVAFNTALKKIGPRMLNAIRKDSPSQLGTFHKRIISAVVLICLRKKILLLSTEMQVRSE